MAQTVGEYLVRRLRRWDVERVFGYPGTASTGSWPIREARRRGPQFVQVATRRWRLMPARTPSYTATRGLPGHFRPRSHTVNGLYDADGSPAVVAIVGQAGTHGDGGDYQQEVDLQTLFRGVAHTRHQPS